MLVRGGGASSHACCRMMPDCRRWSARDWDGIDSHFQQAAGSGSTSDGDLTVVRNVLSVMLAR